MKCTLETINNYRQMISGVSRMPTYSIQESYCQGIDLQNENFYHQDMKGNLYQIPLYDQNSKRINYHRKRNFLVKASNLPK